MAADLQGPSIGEVVSLVRGNTYKSALLGYDGPVLLGLGTIQRNGGFRADSLKTYGGESADRLLLRPGDLYVSLKDVTQSADLLGAIARLPDSISLGRLTQDTVKLDFTGASYPRSLLYWALRSPQYRAFCREHATGTTNLGLAREDFLGYRLPAPSSDTLSLAEVLEAIETRIEVLHQTNATLEAIAQALFKSWFVDFDPVRAKAEGREPEGMDPTTAALFPSEFEDSELGPIPRGWAVASFEAEFDFTMGQSPPGSTYNADRRGSPFFQGCTDFGDVFPVERVFTSAPSRFARAGDVLMSVRAPVGTLNLAADDCAIGRGLCAIRHKSGSTGLTFEFVKASVNRIEAAAGEGALFKSLSKRQLADLRVASAPDALVTAAIGLLDPIVERRLLLARQAERLAQLRDTLLPRLISGKLRIPDAEREIEATTA